MVSSLRVRSKRYNNEKEMRHRMLRKYMDKMFKKEESCTDKTLEKKVIVPDIPKRFIREYRDLRADSNPVTRASFISKMERLHKLKASNPHSKGYADNLRNFIEYSKRTLPPQK